MFTSNRCQSRVCTLLRIVASAMLVLVCHTPAQAQLRLVGQYTMVERGDPTLARTGTLRLYNSNRQPPFAANPAVTGITTMLWVISDWRSVGDCNTPFQAGGHQEGWVLGPVTDPATLAPYDVTATAAYGALTGYYGDAGYSYRLSCSNTRIDEAKANLYAFLFPKATFVTGQGYWVGNVLYQSDYWPAGNWYALYSATPP